MKLYRWGMISLIVLALSACTPETEKTGGSSSSGGGSSGGSGGSSKPELKLSNAEVSESKSSVSVDVTLNKNTSSEMTVSYQIEPVTAEIGKDFTAPESYKVTIPANEKKATISIALKDDDIDEADETFKIVISDAEGKAILVVDTATITIKDDDAEAGIAFEHNEVEVAENSGTAPIKLKLDQPSGFTVKVPFVITGTAKLDDDYTLPASREVIFAPGETEKTIVVTILADQIEEGGETIIFTMGEPDNGKLPKESKRAFHLVISGEVGLNDTGLQHYSDNLTSGKLGTSPSGLSGQDADYGRDKTHSNNADGAGGFSFTKIDESGNILPDTATHFRCVKDNVTGVTWEVKAAPRPADLKVTLQARLPDYLKSYVATLQSLNVSYSKAGKIISKTKFEIPKDAAYSLNDLREAMYEVLTIHAYSVSNTYTWLSTNDKNNGGSRGSIHNPLDKKYPQGRGCIFKVGEVNTARGAFFGCTTESYVNELNRFGICGYKNWRMPDIKELRSIQDLDTVRSGNGTLQAKYFPYSTTGGNYEVYSGTPATDDGASAWCVNIKSGEVRLCNKQIYRYHIRAARTGEE